MDNVTSIVGNLTADPEMRFTNGGKSVCNLSVAINKRVKNNQGQWEDELEGYFKVTAWGSLAENVTESLHKGARVVVTGRLRRECWKGADGGQRETYSITADEIAPSLRWSTATVTKATKKEPAAAGAGEWS